MSYSITTNHRKSVRWLVEKTRSSELPEGGVLYSWSSNDGFAALPNNHEYENQHLPDYFSRSTFRVLQDGGLITLEDRGGNNVFATLRQKAYEAVDNDFAGEPDPDGQTVYNLGGVQGSNSRVNINSQDHSTNVVDESAKQLFNELRQAVEVGVGDESEKQELLDSIQGMEQAASDKRRFTTYADFVSLAANHVTVVRPFVVALSKLLV